MGWRQSKTSGMTTSSKCRCSSCGQCIDKSAKEREPCISFQSLVQQHMSLGNDIFKCAGEQEKGPWACTKADMTSSAHGEQRSAVDTGYSILPGL